MKFLKKHFAKFIMAFTLAFTSIFVAFGCNTYAFTIDNNGNLVGKNIFYINQPYYNDFGGVVKEYSPETQILTLNGENTIVESNGVLYDFDLEQGTYYLKSFFISGTSNGVYRLVAHTLDWSWQTTLYVGTSNGSTQFTISESSNIVRLEFYGDLNTFNNLQNYISITTNNITSWEPYGTWYSQENYDNLQDSYDSMSQQYKDLKDSIYFGCFAFLDSVNIYCYDSNNVATIYTSDLDSLVSNHYIENSIFYFSTLVTDYLNKNINFVKCDVLFHFDNMNYSFVNLAFTSDSSFDFGCTLIFGNNINYSRFITLSNEQFLIDSTRISKYAYLYDSYTVSNINFYELTNITYPDIIIASNNSYSLGYNDGVQSKSSEIESLKNVIDDIRNTNYALSQTINELTIAYNDLNTSYENMLSGNNFANLFFTIAETPFASFKQIWNIDFLGVNLAGFVTGILFLGLVIWIIKKIF